MILMRYLNFILRRTWIQGCKYYIGQHGGTYFVVEIGSNFYNEIDTSDNFFSWGYKSSKKK